jgi:hypothetical protein
MIYMWAIQVHQCARHLVPVPTSMPVAFHMPFAPFSKFSVRFHLFLSVYMCRVDGVSINGRTNLHPVPKDAYNLRIRAFFFPLAIAPVSIRHDQAVLCPRVSTIEVAFPDTILCGPDDKDCIAKRHGEIGETQPVWGLHSIKIRIYYFFCPRYQVSRP